LRVPVIQFMSASIDGDMKSLGKVWWTDAV